MSCNGMTRTSQQECRGILDRTYIKKRAFVWHYQPQDARFFMIALECSYYIKTFREHGTNSDLDGNPRIGRFLPEWG